MAQVESTTVSPQQEVVSHQQGPTKLLLDPLMEHLEIMQLRLKWELRQLLPGEKQAKLHRIIQLGQVLETTKGSQELIPAPQVRLVLQDRQALMVAQVDPKPQAKLNQHMDNLVKLALLMEVLTKAQEQVHKQDSQVLHLVALGKLLVQISLALLLLRRAQVNQDSQAHRMVHQVNQDNQDNQDNQAHRMVPQGKLNNQIHHQEPQVSQDNQVPLVEPQVKLGLQVHQEPLEPTLSIKPTLLLISQIPAAFQVSHLLELVEILALQAKIFSDVNIKLL